jgi:DNA ligase-1
MNIEGSHRLQYSLLVDAYEKIGATSKRLEMTDFLVELLKTTPSNLVREVAYLTQGKLYPDFMGIEMGMAEKMAMTSIARASGVDRGIVMRQWKEVGDLGSATESLLLETNQTRLAAVSAQGGLRMSEVYETFREIAQVAGQGTVESKVHLLAELLSRATPTEAKYLIRTVMGRLRLGVGDMTFLDALAIAYGGGKDARGVIERAYNLSSDLGLVSETLARDGLAGITTFRTSVGRPIRPMLCERLTSAEEILEKLGGKGAAEFKYDGLRIQAHVTRQAIFLFSRRLENITSQFPDITEALRARIEAESAIVEGECVAVDQNTGELQPFQVITQRRGRKYHIQEKIAEIPVVLKLFDVLYLDGKTVIDSPYLNRREMLERIVKTNAQVQLTPSAIVKEPHELDQLMDGAIEAGCEGLVVKAVGSESIYHAGARGFLWIKYKREYKSEMADTVDLVVVGAFAGRGRRAGTYGALLMAGYDVPSNSFKTVCKLGTGFDDETLVRLPEDLKEYRLSHSDPRVDSKIEADYWFAPGRVLEVVGAELTLSPTHTCGIDAIKKGSGLAVRFPRFTGKLRDDKAPEDATTVKELLSMYRSQLKRVK